MRYAILAWVGLLAIGLVPSASAATEAGLSGQCYNADGSSGGHDNLYADSDGNVGVLTVTGAVYGLAEFATHADQALMGGDACSRYDCGPAYGPCAPGQRERADYLEVHVSQDGSNVAQACYDGSVRTDGGCPTRADGP